MERSMSVRESKFYSDYKKVFGISPIKDIINARTETAKNYLLSGKYSVSEVAEIVGYDNEFHFIRQFRDMTGVTPGNTAKMQKSQSTENDLILRALLFRKKAFKNISVEKICIFFKALFAFESPADNGNTDFSKKRKSRL